MNVYIITRKSDGAEVYRYGADGPIEWNEFPFAQYEHTALPAEAAPPAPSVYNGRRILSKLEFLRLFTATERIGLRTAAKANAVIEDYMALMELSQEINLEDADTVTGLNTLEAVGLLGAGRAAEVLNG